VEGGSGAAPTPIRHSTVGSTKALYAISSKDAGAFDAQGAGCKAGTRLTHAMCTLGHRQHLD